MMTKDEHSTLRDVLYRYGIPTPISIERVGAREVWEVGDSLVVKRYEDENAARKEALLSQALRPQGIKTAEFLMCADGGYDACHDGGYYCLMRKLGGTHIALESALDGGFEVWSYSIGSELGKLHLALAHLGERGGVHAGDREPREGVAWRECDLMAELRGQIADLEADGIALSPEIAAECLSSGEMWCDLPKQLIHRDVWFGNFLMDGSEVAGFVDFADAELSAAVYDVVYFAQSVLVAGDYRGADFMSRWRHMLARFLEGYGSVRELTQGEIAAMQGLSMIMQVGFVSYCCGIEAKRAMVSRRLDLLEWIWRERLFEKIFR